MNVSTRPLTDRQAEMLGYICANIREKGYAPTIRELRGLMNIRSTNGVSDHLKYLERKGYIRRDELKSRAIIVLRGVAAAADGESAVSLPPPSGPIQPRIPIYSRLDPMEVCREIRRPSCTPTASYAVMMRGEALSGAGIRSGDYLFVDDTSAELQPGKLVVVRCAEMVLIRFFTPEGGGANGVVRLLANDADARSRPPLMMRAADFRSALVGVVCGLFRPDIRDAAA